VTAPIYKAATTNPASQVANTTPQYNQSATPAAPAKQGSNTMMIVVIAVVATLVIGFLACAVLGAMLESSAGTGF
jgi:hypothetical protein